MPKHTPGGRHVVANAKKYQSETSAKRRQQRERRAHARMFELMAGWR